MAGTRDYDRNYQSEQRICFSDLNNLKVITTTSNKYGDAFGFTEKEVWEALNEYAMADKMEGVELVACKRIFKGEKFYDK